MELSSCLFSSHLRKAIQCVIVDFIHVQLSHCVCLVSELFSKFGNNFNILTFVE